MLAYLCDRCPAKTEVVNGNLVLPQGWMRYEMEEGTGLMNNLDASCDVHQWRGTNRDGGCPGCKNGEPPSFGTVKSP